MFTLRAEHDEYDHTTKVICKGETYQASFTRGFLHPQEMQQFIRKMDTFEDVGKLVIIIDIVKNDGKLMTTFCYNTLEFNEFWTLVR